MKFNKIKAFISAAGLVLLVGTTSCVGDLDVTPINPQQTMEADYDALFNKVYASFALTGQTGPAGSGDVADIDEGQSDFYRMSWYLNEFTTDEAHWVWATDAGLPDLLHNSYGASNVFSVGFYYRLYFTITLCNFYLEQVPEDGTTETAMRRAEVRFIRALQYYYVMDMYGNAAFMTTVSSELAERYTRLQFFNFVESELLDCVNSMADAGQNTYGRVDKVAVWNLLSRLYLNAEVYTGNARWEDAMDYADKVINNGYYHLCTVGATDPSTGEVYSPYQMLFLADNNETEARYEMIFPVMFDGVTTKSYGGMNFLILAAYSSDMSVNVPSGTNNSWNRCTRVRKQLLDKFYTTTEAPAGNSVATMTAAANDAGYGCVKFRNVRSDGQANQVIDYVNTDLPLFRIAEAYLTYAEASTRLNGTNSDASEKINALRRRANAATQNIYTLDNILDEWSREFWFEGRRRMDLIRFGRFGGQASYKWEWMGGTYDGAQFGSYMNIFAIPENDLTNNGNLTQNPGY